MHRESFFKLPLSETDPHLSWVPFSEVSSAREDRLVVREETRSLYHTQTWFQTITSLIYFSKGPFIFPENHLMSPKIASLSLPFLLSS